MDVVERNLRQLLERAKNVPPPTSEENRKIFEHLKCQLMNSVLFYITRIVSSGMDHVANGQVPRGLPSVLSRSCTLQQETWNGISPLLRPDRDDITSQNPGCFSPLVLYLKLLLSSDDSMRDDKSRDGHQILERVRHQILERVRHLLEQLDTEAYVPDKEKFYPGLPSCIMALYKPNLPAWGSTITSSKDRYHDHTLNSKSDRNRKSRLEKLQNMCSEADRDLIQRVETCSSEFLRGVKDCHAVDKKTNALRMENERFQQFVEKSAADKSQKRVVLGGHDSVLATWKPDGEQLPSYMLDHYRFRTTRPEYNSKPSSSLYATESCAEWFGFVELLASGTEMEEEGLLSALTLD